MNKSFITFIGILFFCVNIHAATICVSNNFNSGTGSLRWAIGQATNGDTIDISLITGETITLASPLPDITVGLVMKGEGQGITIDAQGNSRIFVITTTGTVELANITFINGEPIANSNGGNGGAIWSDAATLNLTDCVFRNNYSNGAADNRGGAIYVENTGATATLRRCLIENNESNGEGGGIGSNSSATIIIDECIIRNNISGGNGGGIDGFTGTSYTITNTEISGNTSSQQGGGIGFDGDLLELTNCTVFGNSANTNGGGIVAFVGVGNPLTLDNCTFIDNTAGSEGGAVYVNQFYVISTNSIFCGNTAPTGNHFSTTDPNRYEINYTIICNDDSANAFNINQDTLISTTGNNFLVYNNSINWSGSTAGNIYGINSASITAGALANNGGFSQTVALISGSPALKNGTGSNAPFRDQRGITRTCGIDIGAYQERAFDVGLSPDIKTLCGQSFPLTLTANVSNTAGKTYSWYYNGASQSSTSSSYNITTSNPGIYTVRVDSGVGCYEIDSIEVSAQLEDFFIRPRDFDLCEPLPISLCNPSSVDLSTIYTNPAFTYEWEYSDSGAGGLTEIPSAGNSPTLNNIATSGLYRLTISASGCGSVSDTISIFSTEIEPIDTVFCPDSIGSTIDLSVTGSGEYKWFDSPSGGSVVAVGTSVSIPTPMNDTVFFVEDTSVKVATVARSQSASCSFGSTQWHANNNAAMNFDVFNEIILDSLTVHVVSPGGPCCCGAPTFNVTVNIEHPTQPGFPQTVVAPITCGGGGNVNVTAVVDMGGIVIPPNTGYEINLSGTNTNVEICNGISYPLDYFPNISITGNASPNAGDADKYLGVYDWWIRYFSTCARTPVRATVLCPLPVTFLSLEIKALEKRALLSWSALENEEFSHYYVLHKPAGSEDYKQINSAINSKKDFEIAEYEFKTQDLSQGIHYFKIAQIDSDGSTYYSEVKSVKFEYSNFMRVIPNPAEQHEGVILEFLENQENAEILIFSHSGEVVLHQNINGSQEFIDLSSVSSGLYFIKVQSTDGEVFSEKLVVK